MPALKAQVVFPAVSGLAKDTVVNTFHFRYASTISAVGDAIRDALRDFYNTDAGGNVRLGAYLSPHLVRAQSRIKIYTVGDGPQGPPVQEHDLELVATPSANSIPEEVALCLSYQAQFSPGVPQARRRGRIFLGPFSMEALGGTNVSRPAPNLLVAAQAAGDRLVTASKAANGWAWVVYSAAYAGRAAIPRSNAPDLPAIPAREASWVDVDNGWVDNAWDTQRRRGRAASARSLFS